MQEGEAMSDKPFQLDINLDDEAELELFLDTHELVRGVALAHRLGFRGRRCKRAADALMNYAQNKRAARSCRFKGRVATAQQYEDICDRIYREDIQPLTQCW
jgi:hypothetical protein